MEPSKFLLGRRVRRAWVYLVVVSVFVVYAAWQVGPYLRSSIVRDAAVTTWLRAAVAPIDGTLVTPLPEVETAIGPDGRVAVIRNELLLKEKIAVEATRDSAILAQLRAAEAKDYLDDLEALERKRLAARDRLAQVFREQLKTEIADLGDEIEVNAEQVDVLQRIVDRRQALAARGTGSAAQIDEELLRLSGMKARQAQLAAALNFARLRAEAAEDGVYIVADGTSPDWVRYGELELKLEQSRARHDLHAAEADLAETQRDTALEEATLERLSEATVAAPPGSVVFSVIAAPAATVIAGDRIVDWIDCTTLLVDVPVSDAELPLIDRGTRAEVVLEGESRVRSATVLLTRGSAATLGQTDLAAVAKGRGPGVAQVLLTLDADRAEFDRCPVGWAAYVEFPDVGLIDVIRARLRL